VYRETGANFQDIVCGETGVEFQVFCVGRHLEFQVIVWGDRFGVSGYFVWGDRCGVSDYCMCGDTCGVS